MAINFRKFLEGIGIVGKASSASNTLGDVEVLTSNNKMHFHNGTSNSPVVTEAHSATLTNKTIDADSNTISNIDNNEIKANAAIDATKIANGSVSNTEFQYLDGVTSAIQTQLDAKASATDLSNHIADTTTHGTTGDIVGTSDSQTLTNKTIDGDNNTIQDLALTTLKTNITDANKFLVRDGSGIVVSNTKDVPTGTVVGTSDTQTLTNKTIDGDNNTVQDLALTSLKTNVADANFFLSRDGSGVVVSNIKAVPAGNIVGDSASQTLTNKQLTGAIATDFIEFDSQGGDPTAPSNTGDVRVYAKSGNLFTRNSAGTVTQLGAGGGGTITSWASLSGITYSGMGTPTDVFWFYRRVGDTVEIKGSITLGSTSASDCYLILPSGYTIDSSKLTSTTNRAALGKGVKMTTSTTGIGDGGNVYAGFYNGTNTNRIYITDAVSSNTFLIRAGNSMFASGQGLEMYFSFPITEYA